MATIVETIEIDATVGETRARWNEYLAGMIVGPRRRIGETEDAGGWRPAEREAEDGAVEFSLAGAQRTRVTLALDYPDTGAPGELSGARRMEALHHQLITDLHGFKDYAEGRLRKAG